ncbi:MAG: transposase [Methanobacteriaceae archaeon]|jgi:transposase-like protein|nr:transposase [Candidatus Methanorudis spinitermitis]
MDDIVDNKDKFFLKEEDALRIFRSIRWADGVYCPKCKSFNIYNRGIQGNSNKYSCNECENNFSDFTNTPFEYNKIPLAKIIYIIANMRSKSINKLAIELELHRNTVSRHHKRIREFFHKKHRNSSFDGETEKD